ncbi:MAG TPA: EamA family transporter RarD [Mycobacteriales bacterium]|nr:EamA family transporter RarD [Mycobacteriales bacterium]
MDEQRQGLVSGVAAYFCWGLFPLFFQLLEPAGALEVLSQRVVWSLAFVAVLLGLRRRWGWVRTLGWRRFGLLLVAAAVISVNWGLFIWGVNNGHVVETSLGYFINPLVTVALGTALLGERMRRGQWAALGLGALSVLVLAVDYGRPPWLALALAFSFATYGLVKKRIGIPAAESLGVETAVISVPALAYLGWLTATGGSSFGAHGVGHALLLIASGPITAIPLLFFAAAASRLPLSTVGLLQYLTPSLQFASGVLVFHEPLPAARLAGFALVWLALVVFTAESVRHSRRARPAAAAGPAVTGAAVRTG